MASYHFAVQVLGRAPKVDRSTGRMRPGASAVAAAAYRARCALRDERRGRTEDYRRKDGLQQAEIMLPQGAAPWLADREKLWNHVEALEKREDAQVAREINMALPHELTDAQRVALVRGFVAEQFVAHGMVADIAWHRPVASAGDDPRNFHAHILLTLRQGTPEGLRRVKTREWNSRELIGEWRAAWRDHQNSMLREAGHAARVDHRSLEDQRDAAIERRDRRALARLDRMPEIHVGPKARQMQRREFEPQSRVREVGPRRLKYGRDPHQFGYVSEAMREQQREARRAAARLGRMPDIDIGPMAQQRQQLQYGRDPHRFGYVSGAMREEQREAWRAARRLRDYPRFDHGTRLNRLTDILTGNDQALKARIAKTERQAARLARKLDHWGQRMTFKLEGAIGGARFRWLRASKAAEERAAREKARQKAEHAARRAAQVKELIAELQLVFLAARGGREAVLRRQREVADWTRRVAIERERGRGRERRPT